MVSLDAVRASNASLKNLSYGLVAVFVGATSGIGESTLKQLFRHTTKPRVYIVGRSQEAATRIISELQTIQPSGEASFIQKDLTLLKNVREVCSGIEGKEDHLNLLFMTPGTLSLKGRDETEEGLDRKLVTNCYARTLFAQRLLPLLRASSPHLSRVVSVLDPGGISSSFDLSNMDLKRNYSLANAMCHATTMTSFAFEEMAKQDPGVSFVHAYPGLVKTGFLKEQNYLMRKAGQVIFQLAGPWTIDIDESGERHLWAATSGTFPPRTEGEAGASEEGTGKGSDGTLGSGAYLIGASGEWKGNEKALAMLREQNAGEKVTEHLKGIFGT